MHLRGAGAMYQPPCVCSTSGIRCTAPAPVSSASHSPPGMLHRTAEAAPMRQPSLAPLVIDTGEYRRNVGIVLVNKDGRVWAGRRVDDRLNTWQMPQGGIDPGGLENPMTAAVRELREETGITSARLVALHDPWLEYDYPTEVPMPGCPNTRLRYRGQTQKWCLMYFYGGESEIDLDRHGEREFSEYAWLPLEALPEKVVSFKRRSYAEVCRVFGPTIRRRFEQQQLKELWWTDTHT